MVEFIGDEPAVLHADQEIFCDERQARLARRGERAESLAILQDIIRGIERVPGRFFLPVIKIHDPVPAVSQIVNLFKIIIRDLGKFPENIIREFFKRTEECSGLLLRKSVFFKVPDLLGCGKIVAGPVDFEFALILKLGMGLELIEVIMEQFLPEL